MRALLLCAFFTFPALASAHDLWMQPSAFYVKPNQKIDVHLMLGDSFANGSTRAFQMKVTPRFELMSSVDEKVDLLPLCKDGAKPATDLRLSKPGNYWLVHDRKARLINLSPEKFKSYLGHEGLTNILEQRRKLKEEDKVGRELYGRYLKCIFQVDEADEGTWKMRTMQRLEIVPLSNPCTAKPGETLKVQVFFEGKPLGNAPIFARRRDGKKVISQDLKTDAKGIATVNLDAAGDWIVRLVHVRRCVDRKDADWESFWGAMTFAIRK